MALAHIFYNSALVQSVISMQIARIKAETMGYTTTITDLTGKNEAQLLEAVQAVSAGTMTEVYVCSTTQATYSSAGLLTYDHLAEIDNCLITASKGVTVVSGTCGSNSTVTEIVLASTASAVDDTYNGKFIRTAGGLAKNRYITDYVGSTKACTVATTTTAITTTSTYVVFTASTKVHLIGDAVSNETASHVAWRTLFPTKTIPVAISILGGYGTHAYYLNGNTDGVNTFEQAVITTRTSGGGSHSTTELADTSYFTASAHIGQYVGIESGTLGVGQVRRIASNTVSALTVTPAWTTPTGTVVYTVSVTEWLCLAHKYWELVVPTYLYATDSDTFAIWKQLIDKYNTLSKSTTRLDGDLELLKTYLQKGKCIFDAKVKGVVS